MSEIRANTISDAAGTGPVTLTGQSAAKAYFCYDHAGATIDESINVSSIVDLTTGRFDVSFTNSMITSTYGAVTASFVDYNTSRGSVILGVRVSDVGSPNAQLYKTTSAINFDSIYSSNSTSDASAVDLDAASATIHGDLA